MGGLGGMIGSGGGGGHSEHSGGHSEGTKHWRRREICLGTAASGCCMVEYPSSTEQLLRVYSSAQEGL